MSINERLAHPGMPPLSLNELGHRVIEHTGNPHIRTEYYWVEGEQPHLGKVIDGYTGRETFIEIYINGTYMRLRHDFRDLALDHPLSETQDNVSEPIQIYPEPVLIKPAA